MCNSAQQPRKPRLLFLCCENLGLYTHCHVHKIRIQDLMICQKTAGHILTPYFLRSTLLLPSNIGLISTQEVLVFQALRKQFCGNSTARVSVNHI